MTGKTPAHGSTGRRDPVDLGLPSPPPPAKGDPQGCISVNYSSITPLQSLMSTGAILIERRQVDRE